MLEIDQQSFSINADTHQDDTHTDRVVHADWLARQLDIAIRRLTGKDKP